MRFALRMLAKKCREQKVVVRLQYVMSKDTVIADALSRGAIIEAKTQVQRLGWHYEEKDSPLMHSWEDTLRALNAKHKILDYSEEDTPSHEEAIGYKRGRNVRHRTISLVKTTQATLWKRTMSKRLIHTHDGTASGRSFIRMDNQNGHQSRNNSASNRTTLDIKRKCKENYERTRRVIIGTTKRTAGVAFSLSS